MQADPALAGRVSFPGFVSNDQVVRMAAGSSLLMLPSLYEPFGLSHLEAMRLGALAVVHAVDGLRASVSDPAVTPPEQIPEDLRPYGQTGIFMEPVDTPAYWAEMVPRLEGKPGPTEVMDSAARKLGQALDRAVALDGSEAGVQVRHNAMRYVEERHTWEEIAHRYAGPIDAAVAAARSRQAATS